MTKKLKLTREERAALHGIMSKLGAIGGSASSEAKRKAAQENAKLGGRPTLEEQGKPVNYMALKKRESRARLAKAKEGGKARK
jgi:hypothetical protein